jgi:DNA/RNA endonuclease G (NUC1)
LKAPKLVIYKLYKGGGDCKRNNFHFKDDGKIPSDSIATSADYSFSNYQKGHLVNAEDFAYDCELDELTFRYYNCFPQSPNLNKGIFKKDETLIRKISQTDSLLIFVGGFYNYKTIGNGVHIPYNCFKVVYSLHSNEIIYCYVFTNDDNSIRIKTNWMSLNGLLLKNYGLDLRNLVPYYSRQLNQTH